MPGLVSLDTIRTQAKQRADMENSDFVSDTEWATYIQNSAGELYDLVLEGAGEDWYITGTLPQNTSPGTPTYTLTPDGSNTIYKVLKVMLEFNGRWRAIRKLKGTNGLMDAILTETDSWSDPYSVFYTLTWRQGGDVDITIWPFPPYVTRLLVFYVPSPTDIDNASNLFQSFSGWEEYLVVDAAMKALEKEESDTRALMARKAALRERILHHAQTMNIGEGATLIDQTEPYFIDGLPRYA